MSTVRSTTVVHIHFRSTKALPALNGTGSFAPGKLVVRDINSFVVEAGADKTVVTDDARKAKLVARVTAQPEMLRFYFKKGNTMSFYFA